MSSRGVIDVVDAYGGGSGTQMDWLASQQRGRQHLHHTFATASINAQLGGCLNGRAPYHVHNHRNGAWHASVTRFRIRA